MVKRDWDPKNKYKDGFLKEYDHWIVEVSFRQHTLGSFIIFAKRYVEKISDLYEYEIIELKEVMKDMETALSQNLDFRPSRFNYLQMGNALHSLHFHGIPRYMSPRKFQNKIWTDTTWGHPPVWSTTEVEKDLVMEIKKSILQYF